MDIHVNATVEKFITSLQAHSIAKVLRTIDLLERFGNQLSMPHSKKLNAHLFELRIRGQQEVRILYCFHKGKAHLLLGFIKKDPAHPNTRATTSQ